MFAIYPDNQLPLTTRTLKTKGLRLNSKSHNRLLEDVRSEVNKAMAQPVNHFMTFIRNCHYIRWQGHRLYWLLLSCGLFESVLAKTRLVIIYIINFTT